MKFLTFIKLSKVKISFIFLLIIIVVSLYFLKAFSSYYEYKTKVNPKLELTYDIFKFFVKNEFKKEKVRFMATKPLSDKQSPLKTFRITVDQKDLNTLNVDLPTSGKDHYIKAYLSISDESNKIREIQLRYRGDNNFHWLYPQKSLRIKLAKTDIYNMEKTFNLLNPPYDYTLVDILNYNLSSSLGLIAPDYFPVRVFINGKFMGVYMYLSQVDESLLRKHKIMPGSIYFGDVAPPNKDGVSSLWFNSKYWDKKASRNAEQKSNREDIDYFIDSIKNLNQLEFYDFVNTYLAKEKYFNYFALDVIFGSEHHDYHHNHKLYFDPYKGKFEPIQWDLRFWHPYGAKDVSVYNLIEKISLNPILEDQRDKVAYDLMNSEPFKQKNIKQSIDDLVANQILDLKADKLKDSASYEYKIFNGWFSKPYQMKDLHKTLRDKLWHYKVRQEKLKKIYNDANIRYQITKLSENKYLLDINSFGNSAVTMKIKSGINIAIYKDLNFNKILDKDELLKSKVEILYPARKIVSGAVEHFGKLLSGNTHIVPTKEYYSFIVKTQNQVLDITNFIFTNKITSKPVKPIKTNKIISDNKTDSIHPWLLPEPKQKTITLQGDIKVTKDLIFDKYTKVFIKPNTNFYISEKKSIYFYGQVTAIGTKKEPIKFIPAIIEKPWGLIAVQGVNTSNSKFHYCIFENGSIATRNLIHYTSQFNIHDTKDFEVKNCFIGKNHIGDDAMHIAYSNGIVDNCIFDNARSDGLDIDISDVVITNNIFRNSGNDGLDIMTTTMNALNNDFIDAGDKGISVGEWSEATITNSTFTRTNIGLEIKDKSKVIASNLTFIDSKEKAINLYNKNKRYDAGGFLQAKNLKFIGNDTISKDKKSKVTIDE